MPLIPVCIHQFKIDDNSPSKLCRKVEIWYVNLLGALYVPFGGLNFLVPLNPFHTNTDYEKIIASDTFFNSHDYNISQK